ncbi:hypothetical protein X770_25730 [Mesorhizobium sp. LSJC269B00]|nr:hypothetical protein X770_25730 [Mesorhizobium sp. LSJC269B00]
MARKLCEHVPDPSLTEAVVVDDDVGHPLEHRPAIVVEVVKGGRVSIFAGATPTLVTAVVKALR